MDETTSAAQHRRRVSTVALVAGGLLAGGVLGATLSATAVQPTPTTTAPTTTGTPAPGEAAPDEARCGRGDETPLEGEVAAKVEAAALAAYPGATIVRVETDSDGVYEAHLVTADGARVTVEVGKDFAITGEESMSHGGRHGGGPGRHRWGQDGDDARGEDGGSAS
jgi:hypothetical protein